MFARVHKLTMWFGAGIAVMLACALAMGDTQPLHLKVPIYQEVNTHIHRPPDLKPHEKRPAILIIGGAGCKLAGALTSTQGVVTVHFSPAENLPPRFRGWEERLGHAGQDAICVILKHLVSLPEVDRSNVGIVTFSFGVVGATGALARHPDLRVKFLIDWEGPSGPQNLRYVPPGHKVVRNHPARDSEFWQERTASEFIKQIKCRYLRVQAEIDHVQILGHNQHAIEMLNNATRGASPWTRCNDNKPNILYDQEHPEKEKSKWLPRRLSGFERDLVIMRYVAEMTNMPSAS